MKLTVNVTNKRQHIDLWLTLWQAGLGLTEREKSVIAEILLRRDELVEGGIKEPFLSKLLFDADSRKIYCSALSISSYNFTNILGALKSKGVLNDTLLNPQLIPDTSLIFDFKYDSK